MKLALNHLQQGMGTTAANAERFHPFLEYACEAYEINTTRRLAAFLAQIGHESGRLHYVREIWGPTAAQRRYEGRADLGNIYPGDGKRFMGRGLIQITGRRNYSYVRDGLRELMTEIPDFEQYPEELEKPAHAALSAAWFWHEHGLNELADHTEFETITRKINGGLNGYADRVRLYSKALRTLT